ncbi:hypothetical protein PGT21_025905 [Puccinia graminis f. sp. tritici]|nr:hypothetical protein PGT21_025905 [Puccinia graminis f. sp. tritici]
MAMAVVGLRLIMLLTREHLPVLRGLISLPGPSDPTLILLSSLIFLSIFSTCISSNLFSRKLAALPLGTCHQSNRLEPLHYPKGTLDNPPLSLPTRQLLLDLRLDVLVSNVRLDARNPPLLALLIHQIRYCLSVGPVVCSLKKKNHRPVCSYALFVSSSGVNGVPLEKEKSSATLSFSFFSM